MTGTAVTANRRHAAVSKNKGGLLPVTNVKKTRETGRKGAKDGISPTHCMVLFAFLVVTSYFIIKYVYKGVIDFKHRVHIETEKHLEKVYNFSANLRQQREQLQDSLAKLSQNVRIATQKNSHGGESTNGSLSLIPRRQDQPTVLVSADAVVTASVRGNLGPSAVVVNGKAENWLEDRWQAAKDMNGTPIPGEHFVMLRFARPVVTLEKITLDWETAMATKFVD